MDKPPEGNIIKRGLRAIKKEIVSPEGVPNGLDYTHPVINEAEQKKVEGSTSIEGAPEENNGEVVETIFTNGEERRYIKQYIDGKLVSKELPDETKKPSALGDVVIKDLPSGKREFYLNGEKLRVSIHQDGSSELLTKNGKSVLRMKSAKKNLKQKTTVNKEIAPEEKEVIEEIRKMPEKERRTLMDGISLIGLTVEQKKNSFFASTFNLIKEGVDEKGTVGRFCKELKDSFARDSETAKKKAEDIKTGKEKHKIAGVGGLAGNVVRYTRMITDLTGKSLASPLRYVMMGGMFFTRASEAGKEARLKNEEVINKTRIGKNKDGKEETEEEASIRAFNEAMKIYEMAGGKIGTTNEGKINEFGNPVYDEGSASKNFSAEKLKNSYLMNMPKDITERLKKPSEANKFIQKILRGDMMTTMYQINFRINRIEKNNKLSPEEQREKIEKITKGYEQTLRDYDRILTQYGTVDELAMAGRYAQTAGKAVVSALTVETIVLSVEKLYEFASIQHDFHPIDSTGRFVKHLFEKGGKANTHLQDTQKFPPVSPHENTLIHHNIVSSNENTQINPNAVIQKGGSPEHAFIQQIKNNPDLAKNLGYKEGMDLQKFAGTKAHEIAIRNGFYVDGKSALVQKGMVVQLDNHGHISSFGTPDASGKVSTLEGKYNGPFLSEHHEPSIHHEIPENTTDSKSFVNENRINFDNGHHFDAENAKHITETLNHQEASTSIHGTKFIERSDGVLVHTEKGMTIEVFPDKHVEFYDTHGKLLGTHPKLTAEDIYRTRISTSIGQAAVDNTKHTAVTPDYFNQDHYKHLPDTLKADISHIYGGYDGHHGLVVWENVRHLKAEDVLGSDKSRDTAVGVAKDHIKVLKRFCEEVTHKRFEPKKSFFGGKENLEHYMERGLKLLSQKGKLGDFETSIRNNK